MFGEELRRQRTTKHLSLRALGAHLSYSFNYLGQIERGDRPAPPQLAPLLDDYFGTGDRFCLLAADPIPNANDDSARVASDPLVAEQKPDGKVLFVPSSRRRFLRGVGALGILAAGRTALPPTTSEIKPIEAFRMAHRTLIDEDNVFGPEYVIPKVQRQVAAIESALNVVDGSDARQLRYMQTCFSEFCGWLFQDLGDYDAAQDWMNVALSRAHLSGDHSLTSFILGRQSQLAGDMGDLRTAVDSADAALIHAPNARLAAIAHTFGAHGRALARDHTSSEQSYEAARRLSHQFEGDSPWGVWLDDAYIDVHRARSLTVLGRYSEAAETYSAALSNLPEGYHRDRGVYLGRQARAQAGSHDIDASAETGLRALTIAIDTRSGRIATDLMQLSKELAGKDTPTVSAFQAALRDAVSA